jgi:hypothetical protein
MVAWEDWSGRIAGTRTDDFDDLTVVLLSTSSGNSWSGPFRVTASDGNDYFVKSLDTCPAGWESSLAIEQIVAEVGRLIGAPVCETSLIVIPPELAGVELKPGRPLRPGLAHASRALERADELGRPSLIARNQDDNSARHVGVYALFDWCFGADQQWLYDLDADRTLFSHDHGLYLFLNQGRVDRSVLESVVDDAHELPDPRTGLRQEAVTEVAAALDKIDRASLVNVLRTVPASWPITDEELETVGWFLEHRAPAVATRVRALV